MLFSVEIPGKFTEIKHQLGNLKNFAAFLTPGHIKDEKFFTGNGRKIIFRL